MDCAGKLHDRVPIHVLESFKELQRQRGRSKKVTTLSTSLQPLLNTSGMASLIRLEVNGKSVLKLKDKVRRTKFTATILEVGESGRKELAIFKGYWGDQGSFREKLLVTILISKDMLVKFEEHRSPCHYDSEEEGRQRPESGFTISIQYDPAELNFNTTYKLFCCGKLDRDFLVERLKSYIDTERLNESGDSEEGLHAPPGQTTPCSDFECSHCEGFRAQNNTPASDVSDSNAEPLIIVNQG